MNAKRLHWSLMGETIRRAEVSDDRLVLHLANGKTLKVTAAGFLNLDYSAGEEPDAAA